MRPLRPVSATTLLLFFSSLAQAQGAGVRPPPHAHVQHPPAGVVPPQAKAPAPLRQTTAIAKAWAQQRNLPVREIEVGPPERRVTRLFVPVKSEDWSSFAQIFGNQPRSLLLKLKSGDSHLIAVTGGEEYLWARTVRGTNWHQYFGMEQLADDAPNGHAIVVELNDAESAHIKQWFQHRKNPNDALFSDRCGAKCMDFIGNIEVAPGADGTNTLRSISAQEIQQAAADGKGGNGGSASLPSGKRLFDVLGIARSRDGRNMAYNLVHAANDRVQVIGIPVSGAGDGQMRIVVENGRVIAKKVTVTGDPIERFLKMTDSELLGPLPPQGVAAVVRPVK